jgi:hypothetical protein
VILPVKIPTGQPGHIVGQAYLYRGRAYMVRFVRRLDPVGADHFVEELELETVQEAS